MPTPPKRPSEQNTRTAQAVFLGVARGIRFWAPVWIPSILLWQFTTKGLQPALGEAQRLRDVAPEVGARHTEAKQAFERVQAEAQAWQDPVYKERRRRMRFQEPEPQEPLPGQGSSDPFTEQMADADWQDQGNDLGLEGEVTGWHDLVASPTDPLYDDATSPVQEDPAPALLGGQGNWSVEAPLATTEAPALLLSSPGWTVAPEEQTSPPAQTQPPEVINEPDSPYRVD